MLAQHLGMSVAAEGVETAAQLEAEDAEARRRGAGILFTQPLSQAAEGVTAATAVVKRAGEQGSRGAESKILTSEDTVLIGQSSDECASLNFVKADL